MRFFTNCFNQREHSCQTKSSCDLKKELSAQLRVAWLRFMDASVESRLSLKLPCVKSLAYNHCILTEQELYGAT